MKKSQLRKLIRESLIKELSSSNLAGYFSKITTEKPWGKSVDSGVRANLIGLALPAIEQTSINSKNIAELVSNLLILKDKFDTTDGKTLQQQSEEVQNAVEYLSNKGAITAFNEITDIDKAIAAALKAGADTLGGSTEKIYTASAFPDGMRDSDFYKKAVEDGYKFILKPYLNGRSAQTLPVGDDGFALNEESILKIQKINNYFKNLASKSKRSGIKPLYEQGFDDRLAKQMGMSDDEFEDQVASRDIEQPFPGDDELSIGYSKSSDLIDQLRQDYRNMSDEEIDEFSKEMILHFLDNTTAQATAKIYFGKRGI